jgi:hypothetical protein
LGKSLSGFGNTVKALTAVDSSKFYQYIESHHADSNDVRYEVTVDGKEDRMNKSDLPVRTQRSLAYYIKSKGGKSLGHVKIDQEIESVPHKDTPQLAKRFNRGRYIAYEEDVNDVNDARERAVVEACSMDITVQKMSLAEGEEESDSEEEVEPELDVSELTIKSPDVRPPGPVVPPPGQVTKEDSRTARKNAAVKNGRDVLELYGAESMTLDNMNTPDSSGIPLKKYILGSRKSRLESGSSGSSGDKRGLGTDDLMFESDEEQQGLLIEDIEDDWGVSDSDEEEGETEAATYAAAYEVGESLSGSNRSHPSRVMTKVDEIFVFDMHKDITDPQVRAELFHAVMGKMLNDKRIVSAIAGLHLQNPTVNIDWLKEAAIIKQNVCKTLDFAPPKRDAMLLTDLEQEVQVNFGSQSLAEQRRNNKLNKQANRATYQVVRLVISTCELLKAHPDYKPPIVDSSALQYMNDDIKGMHYLQHALYHYPDDDLEVLKNELARVEVAANNLSGSIADAKVKQAKYSGNWKNLDKASSVGSGKKRKRVAAEKEESSSSTSKKASKDSDTDALVATAVKQAEAKAQKESDRAKKETEALRKEAETVRKEAAALQTQLAQSIANANKAKQDQETSEKNAAEAAKRNEALRKELEDKLAKVPDTPISSSSSSVSTTPDATTTATTTPDATASATAPSEIARQIQVAKREVLELERLQARVLALRQAQSSGFVPTPSLRETATVPQSSFSQLETNQFFGVNAPSNERVSSIDIEKDDVPLDSVLEVLRVKTVQLVGHELNLVWFFDSFLNAAVGKPSPSLSAILKVVDNSDWDLCVVDAQEVLYDNKVLIETSEGPVLNANLGDKTNHHMMLALFACTSLEHDLIKGVLFKLLYSLFGDDIVGKKIGYAGKYEFEIKKRGERFDHKLSNGISFSFFHTADYNIYIAGKDKRMGAIDLENEAAEATETPIASESTDSIA